MADLTTTERVVWDQVLDTDDFRLGPLPPAGAVTGLVLQARVGPTWTDLMVWRDRETRCETSLQVVAQAPQLLLDARAGRSSPSEGCSVWAAGDALRFQSTKPSSLPFLAFDDRYAYAPRGLASGHGASGGDSQNIAWARCDGTVSVSEAALGKIVIRCGPGLWVEQLIAASVMMAPRQVDTLERHQTFRAQDYGGAVESGGDGFYVRAERGTEGDRVIVSFDNALYKAGSAWEALMFFSVTL